MINNSQQSGFWEVALTKRADFLKGKQAGKFDAYVKTGKAVRLNRDAKTTLFATATTTRGGASVARAAARAKLWA